MQLNPRNAHGETLDYTWHGPEPEGSRPIIVIGHGVTGNKDRPFIVALGEELGAIGLPTVRFSFAGNGKSGGEFTAATITKEAGDLAALAAALPEAPLIYIGHSMGWPVGLKARPQLPRLIAFVSLAGMVDCRRFLFHEFGETVPGAGDMWDDPQCPLSYEFVEDLTQVDTVQPLANTVDVPVLWIHGEADDVIPIKEGRTFAAACPQAKFISVPEDGHTFTERTPEMTLAVTTWLRETVLPKLTH